MENGINIEGLLRMVLRTNYESCKDGRIENTEK